MVDSILVLVAVGLTGIELTLIAFAFFIGSLCARARKAEQMNSLTLLASLWATVEAKGLQKSGVINRIIERHHMPKMTEEQLAKVEEEVEKIVGEGFEEAGVTAKKRHDVFMDTFDFDEERAKDKDMSDLV